MIAGLVQQPAALPARVASWPVLVWVGQRSYGIYLWNLPIVALIAATPVPGVAQMPVKLALTFLIPALSFRYIERPCLQLKHRFEAGRATAQPVLERTKAPA
jgi:peptidoglycan/LPS O-acetylase OafA/YrhL